jgi:ribonucleoside-diphosphate reductase beta chain
VGLVNIRNNYKPFIYGKCHDFWLKQQQAHWLPTEVQMGPDIQDWKLNLSETEKQVIAGILKGFIQTELIVNDYWQQVSRWFPHPEISMMASTFSSVESIHTVAYAHLNDTLGIEDYDAFLTEPTAKAKIDRLVFEGTPQLTNLTSPEQLGNIARSLAVFSGFTEGVSLFSSFAVLFNFSRFNKLKGVGQIISWSILDESLHSEAGCWLFRELIKEHPELWTDELKKQIYDAARITIEIEDAFIDKVFDSGEVEGITPKEVKTFIRHRANVKLGELMCKTNWKNLDQEALKNMSWFDTLSLGVSQQDFFAGRETGYSKGSIDFSMEKVFGEQQ